jgi:signal transduction histidine kinase
VRLAREHDVVRWQIQDSGIGIPKESQRHLSEKFYRADNVASLETDGTGLGLYLVRLIVEQLGGQVRCESEEGRGATFCFTVPGRRSPRPGAISSRSGAPDYPSPASPRYARQPWTVWRSSSCSLQP